MEAGRERASKPGRLGVWRLDAGQHNGVATRDVLAHENRCCLAPEWLDVLQPGSTLAVFVPGAYSGEVDGTNDQAAYPLHT